MLASIFLALDTIFGLFNQSVDQARAIFAGGDTKRLKNLFPFMVPQGFFCSGWIVQSLRVLASAGG
jgi:hypothetical protein